MRFRFTNEEIKTISDTELLRVLVVERKSTCTNVYAPLYRRLQELENRITAGKIKEEK